jgi:hypothetical protein
MKDLFRTTVPLYLIVLCLIVIALQNAGFISPHKQQRVTVTRIEDAIDVASIERTVDVNVADTVDVNLAEIVGTTLVRSKNGMNIGVNSTQNTVIPVNWGEISISR